MNKAITVELQFFLISVLSGSVLLLVYDCIRIIRRLIKHDSFFVALEDLFFWVAASLFVFAMMFKENDGIIRGFSIMGMLIGMILYHNIFDDLLVNLIVKLIRILISPFLFAVNKIKQLIRLIRNKGKKIVNFLTRRLKKQLKSVRIALDKRKQVSSVKKQKHLAEKKRKMQEEEIKREKALLVKKVKSGTKSDHKQKKADKIHRTGK